MATANDSFDSLTDEERRSQNVYPFKNLHVKGITLCKNLASVLGVCLPSIENMRYSASVFGFEETIGTIDVFRNQVPDLTPFVHLKYLSIERIYLSFEEEHMDHVFIKFGFSGDMDKMDCYEITQLEGASKDSTGYNFVTTTNAYIEECKKEKEDGVSVITIICNRIHEITLSDDRKNFIAVLRDGVVQEE